MKFLNIIRHPADDEFAAEAASTLLAAGRFIVQLIALTATALVLGAWIVFAG